MTDGRPVPSESYDEDYYLESCGGVEFFRLYGPEVLKPQMAYSLKRAGLEPGMRVLDVGCGRGEILLHARRLGAHAVGTDYAEAALALAGRVSGCPVARCDAKALPFADRSFDRVFLIGVMDHLHDWELEACFREIRRVLKPGGRVIIHTCANLLYYKSWSYGIRLGLARALRACGLGVREPRPPRSGSDIALHVNEHSAFTLKAFFRKAGWRAEVEPRPNYKLVLRELYGEPLPQGFPLKPAPAWKARLYLGLLWRTPLKWLLARQFFCAAEPDSEAPGAAAG